LCSGGANLTFTSPTAPNGASNTYTAQGDFIGFTPPGEDFDVKVGKFSIFLSGLGNGYINKLIDYEIEGKRAVVYKAFLWFGAGGTGPLQLVDDPILMFDGVIYNYGVEEAARSCQITIDCSSLFADFERLNGRKSNNWSNWLFQETKFDQAFNKSGLIVKSIKSLILLSSIGSFVSLNCPISLSFLVNNNSRVKFKILFL
jgi:hypothetical protein